MNRMNRARLIKRSWSISAQAALTIKSRTFHLTGVTPDACWAVARSSAPASGQFAGNTTLVFFLTWFPSYLANERHLPWLHVGFFATPALPCRRDWHPLRRLDLRPVVEANRLRQHQSKVTNNFRFIAVQLYYRGELGSANSTVIIIMSVAFFWPGGWSVWAGP